MFQFYISRVFQTTVRSVLSQCKTELTILHLHNDIEVMWSKTILKTRFFPVLYSDKTWVFDQSERVQGPIYVIIPVYRINCAAFV